MNICEIHENISFLFFDDYWDFEINEIKYLNMNVYII